MSKRICISLVLLLATIVVSAQDAVFTTLKTELERNYSVLSKQPAPAYYILLRLDEIQSLSCAARLGRLQTPMEANSPDHVLSSMLRVGSPQLDNTHEIRESGGDNYSDVRVEAQIGPIDNNPQLLKTAIWTQLDNLYKNNVQVFEKVKANIAVKVEQEDKSPDFSGDKAEKYYEKPLPSLKESVDKKIWEEKVRKYSSVFNKNNDILDGMAFLYAVLSREYFVDTEGREIVQNSLTYNLALAAEALADDGMRLPLNKTWVVHSLDELPSDEEVIREAEAISKNLSALKKAPVVESFTGPAILSPDASGVFFHEIFGHRIEGSRLKQEADAQTFKKKIGEEVLPKHLSVIFDPTAKKFKNTPLNGYYVYDDEGIKAQRVEIVKNGILKDFLMCRTPIDGFSHSNGHGRAQPGLSPVSRQSNMFISSTQEYSDEKLREMLKKEAKAQGKTYAYYFKDVSGGFTQTGRYMPNSFNVTPLIVYKVYVDGRPDELVRGVDLVGTPLAMFSQIQACGNQYGVFNGTCGAESGGIPVACIAPALFVKRIETQKRAKNQTQLPILSKPAVTAANNANLPEDEVIRKAIKEEVERGLKGLKMEGLQSPFFISYTLSDVKNLVVSASLGSITGSDYYPSRMAGCRLLIGDYKCTDENFAGSTGGSSGFDGSPCFENSEEGIRYTIWRDLDAIYKNAAETYQQKLSAIKQLNIPESELQLPDWDKTPVVQLNNIPGKEINFDRSKYETYVKEASAVFKEYKDIFSSDVSLQIFSSTFYFYNTEKTEFRLPVTFAAIHSDAIAKTDEGEMIGSNMILTFSDPGELPSIDELKKQCNELAKKTLAKRQATKMDEAYTGPVLYEGLAVMEAFYNNFFTGDISLIAQRRPITPQGFAFGGNSLEEMMNKRITAKEITIEDLTGTPEYKGQKLIGYQPVDAQGVVPPKKLTLVENGILKTLLSDRVPTPKVPHSNGHASHLVNAGPGTNTGVVRLQHSITKDKNALRKELLAKAKEEGYEYAYIVRETIDGGSIPMELYRVNVADGSEKLIRSAHVNNMDAQVFKKIIAVSQKEQVYNGITGNPISIIAPEAILFGDLEIQKDGVDNYQKPPIVVQP